MLLKRYTKVIYARPRAVRLPARADRLFDEKRQKHMGNFCYRSVQFYFKHATVIFLFLEY